VRDAAIRREIVTTRSVADRRRLARNDCDAAFQICEGNARIFRKALSHVPAAEPSERFIAHDV
jgi:hypothetical protein